MRLGLRFAQNMVNKSCDGRGGRKSTEGALNGFASNSSFLLAGLGYSEIPAIAGFYGIKTGDVRNNPRFLI